MATISGAGAHASAAATDRIPASKAGVKGYLTPAQIREYLDLDGTLSDAEAARDLAQGYASNAVSVTGQIPNFATVTALLADEDMGYDGGSTHTVGAGIVVHAQGFRYEIAASDVTDHHLTTAGSVKLYVLPADGGSVNIMAWNVDNTGATNDTTKIQAAIEDFDAVRFPVGTYTANLDATSDVALIGEDRDRTIIQQSGATGVTLTVNADVELSGLTLKCHATNTASKTIVHAGDHLVRATNVLFTGVNHHLSVGVDARGEFRGIETYTTDNAGLGACCWSAGAVFWNSRFMGYRGTDVRDSVFNDCHFGTSDLTTLCAHLPDGATGNNGDPSGYTGAAMFRNPVMRSAGSGLTCGNDSHPVIINPDIVAVGQGLYARSNSTLDVYSGRVISIASTAVAFSKTTNVNDLGISGESVLERVFISGGNSGANVDLSVPTLSDTYPASIGNVRLIDCIFAHNEDEISPKTSTYHIFQSRTQVYADNVVYANNGETKRIRFKAMKMRVGVYGSDAAKTGCFLSHLDAVTGLALPEGMEIEVVYGGVSSRFVTFASGATGDGGRMDFVGAASTLATTQTGLFRLVMIGTGWRQV